MKAIVYLTYNGVHCCTDGIATQTKTILGCIKSNYKSFANIYEDFHFYIISPKEIEQSEKQDNIHWKYANNITSTLGGKIVEVEFGEHDFWTLEAWEYLSKNAAQALIEISHDYSDVLAICIDPPFLHVPLNFNRNSNNGNVKFLIALYSSSYIHEKNDIRLKRLSWEYLGIASTRLYENIYLANICEFMSNHLVDYYGANVNKFIPFKSSIDINHQDFNPMSKSEIDAVLSKYNIPVDKDLLLAFGRADWIKGFDVLLNQLPLVNNKIHLVLIAVQYKDEIELVDLYKKIILEKSLNCSLFIGYNRDIPKALCQYARTKLVIIPSRGEPFSNIPFEVALWAKKEGPVCLTSNIDGFLEQIDDGYNGFFFDHSKKNNLSEVMKSILEKNNLELSKIQNNAYKETLNNRDFNVNFIQTLTVLK